MDDRDWQELRRGDDRNEQGADVTNDDVNMAIEDLLDVGYVQLDRFVQWLEDDVQVNTRTAQQDCFNAEALVDYLANHHRKSVAELNEFELRWFVFSHYIRKSLADVETENRLLESLGRFFRFLSTGDALRYPDWLADVLDDADDYRTRSARFRELRSADEESWEQGFRDWCTDLEDDLDARNLWLPRDLGDGIVWGNVMGLYESSLYDEANRNWQDQRQELVEVGLDPDNIRQRLTSDYYGWLDTPHARLDDETPRERIVRERLERSEEEDQITD